jgi:hypothetical protein
MDIQVRIGGIFLAALVQFSLASLTQNRTDFMVQGNLWDILVIARKYFKDN